MQLIWLLQTALVNAELIYRVGVWLGEPVICWQRVDGMSFYQDRKRHVILRVIPCPEGRTTAVPHYSPLTQWITWNNRVISTIKQAVWAVWAALWTHKNKFCMLSFTQLIKLYYAVRLWVHKLGVRVYWGGGGFSWERYACSGELGVIKWISKLNLLQ